MPLAHQTIIRSARPEDVDSIVAFSAAMALETEGRQLDQRRLREGTLSLLTSSDRGFFMVAELIQGDQPLLVGQLMITFEWSDWRNAVFWWVQSVYVTPPWRRRGIYRMMHDTIIAQAKADPKVCGIRLYVERDNRTAQTVYQRVGLVPSAYAVYEQDFVLARSNDISQTSKKGE
ncbi:N-acetyltransferase family protein [Petrachloros mirabilis]|nr:GNAT family N-acetyltransferase [Nitrospira sp.]